VARSSNTPITQGDELSSAYEVVGTVGRLFRYPVKSMGAEEVVETRVGWHSVRGDRHYAFVRTGNTTHFPWLTARQVPDLLRYAPRYADPSTPATSSVSVRLPDDRELDVRDEALRDTLGAAHGAPVHLMQVDRGAFDSMELSVTTTASLQHLGACVGQELDQRRFRQNVIVETCDGRPYAEDAWVGGLLLFGEGSDEVRVRLARRIPRCMVVNLHPDTAEQDPRVLKEVARSRNVYSGIYAAIDRIGTLRVGDSV